MTLLLGKIIKLLGALIYDGHQLIFNRFFLSFFQVNNNVLPGIDKTPKVTEQLLPSRMTVEAWMVGKNLQENVFKLRFIA